MATNLNLSLSDQQTQVPQLAPQTPPVPEGQEGVRVNPTIGETAEMAQGKKDISPALQKKMDTYNTALMHIMHNPKTSQNIVDMLKSAPPEQSIPSTALQLTKSVEGSFQKKGTKVEDSVKLCGAMYLVSDLAEIGNSAQLWEKPISEQDTPTILQEVVTKYIHEGLRNKSIDPIKLQADAQELFTEEQNKLGGEMQQKLGLPSEPTASMGIDAYTQKKTAPLEEENTRLKGLLQQQQPQVQGAPQ